MEVNISILLCYTIADISACGKCTEINQTQVLVQDKWIHKLPNSTFTIHVCELTMCFMLGVGPVVRGAREGTTGQKHSAM